MKIRCDAINMTCSNLVEASAEDPGPLRVLCNVADNQDHILGWCTCSEDTTSHFLQSKPAPAQPKPKLHDKKQQGHSMGNQTYRRIYNKPDPNPERNTPFTHHHDLSRYMKDYTKYQSFTMGQDTSFVVKYELAGPSRSVYSRWNDQFSSLGVRGEGVQEETKQGFNYTHNAPQKVGHGRTHHGHSSQDQPLTYHRDQQAPRQLQKPAEPHISFSSVIPDGSVVDKQLNFNISLTGSKREVPAHKPQRDNTDRSQIGGSDKMRKTKRKPVRGGHDKLGQGISDKNQPPHRHYDTIEDYYVKQIEREIQEKMRTAREYQSDAERPGQDDEAMGYDNMQPTVRPIQHRPNQRPRSIVDYTESDPYHAAMAPVQGSQTQRVNVSPEDTERDDGRVLKLPPLQEHVDNIANHERDKEPIVPKLNFQKKKKGKKFVGKKFSSSQYYMDLPSPSRRFAKDSNDIPDYGTATVHQSIPPLASVYSSPDDASKLTKMAKNRSHGSDIVLPKLHKWLSDSAVHKVLWEGQEPEENQSPEPSYRSQKANSNQRMFSQEFLEYANQLRNREVLTKLYENPNADRRSPEAERETQSLPDTVRNQQIEVPGNHSTATHQYPDPSAIIYNTGPPPNTPNEVVIPAMNITQLRNKPHQKKNGPESDRPGETRSIIRVPKKHGAEVRMPRVSLVPEPDKVTMRTNEHVVEVSSMARNKDGSTKYLSSSLTNGKSVWRS